MSPGGLLDTYQAERTQSQPGSVEHDGSVALMRRDDRSKAAWEVISE
jgi:hypothetical protein